MKLNLKMLAVSTALLACWPPALRFRPLQPVP